MADEIDPRFRALMAAEAAPAAAPAPTDAPTDAPAPAAAPAAEVDPRFRALMPTPTTPVARRVIPTEEPSLRHPIDMLTGSSRTEYPDRRELNPGDVARANGHHPLAAILADPQYRDMVVGYLAAPNTTAKMQILKHITGVGDDAFSQDSHGNWMVNYGGETMYINKPGVSDTEVLQAARDAPIAAINVARNVPGVLGGAARALSAGALAAGSSLGFDRLAQAYGSEEPVDPAKAAQTAVLSGVTTAAAPGVARLFGRGVEWLRGGRRLPERTINPPNEVKWDGDQRLIDAGVDPSMYTAEQQAQILDLALKSSTTPTADAFREAAARVRGQESGIPRTRGQTTRDPDQLRREATLRAQGDRRLGDLDAQQGEAATAALEAARLRLSRGNLPMEHAIHPSDAGTALADSLRFRQEQSGARVSGLYDRVAEMKPETVHFARDRTVDFRDRLTTAAADQFNLPGSATEAAIKRVREMTGPAGQNPSVLNLSQVEQLRRQIGAAIRGGAPDSPALVSMSRQLDEWVDAAAEAGAYSGPGETVNALKAARAAARENAADFSPENVPARVSTILKRVTEQGVTGQEVIDGLLDKTADLGGANSRAAIQHVERLTGHRGPNGEIVPDQTMRTMLQQAAMSRLFDGVEATTPQQMRAAADRIDAATKGRGAQVMEHLFDEPQRQSLLRLAAELRDISHLSTSQRSAAVDKSAAAIIGGSVGGTLGGLVGPFLGIPPVVSAPLGVAAGAAARSIGQGAASRAAVNVPAPVTDWRTLVPEQQDAPRLIEGLMRQSGIPAARMLFSPDQHRAGLLD